MDRLVLSGAALERMAPLRPASPKGLYQAWQPCFSKLKPFRRVATRCEKTARIYRAVITLAAIVLWMRWVSTPPGPFWQFCIN